MSTTTALGAIARPLDDRAGLARAVDELLAARAAPPVLLGLGEPAHGIAAFPLLRNELLAHLVGRGFRSVVLETDLLAAAAVDEHVAGAATDLDVVLATGFSHGFGAVPGNRELVAWLREHNGGRAPRERVRFHGFDAPLEMWAPSPRRSLEAVRGHLPAELRPGSAGDLDALLGDDAAWSDPATIMDPAASVGDSDRARALRLVADDLASAVRRAAPGLHAADPAGHARAVAHARTAQGLLRYHAAMARPGPDRVPTLFSLRSEMMAENLLAVVDEERGRGPVLVFAHNAHLQRLTAGWGSAGALAALVLGEDYAVVVTDAAPRPEPGTLQGELAGATTGRRALFPVGALRDALPPTTRRGGPTVPGHIPLDPAELACADAVVWLADAGGEQVRYW